LRLRRFTTIALLCLVPFLNCTSPINGRAQSSAAPLPKFHINTERLQSNLERLSEIGRDPATGGITRLGYSENELAAREYVSTLMKQAGLNVRTDAAGNLFGSRPFSDR
jgi:hypothetical protein